MGSPEEEKELGKTAFEEIQNFLKLIKYINLEIRKFLFSLRRDANKTTLQQQEC